MRDLKTLGKYKYTEAEAHKALEIAFNETFMFWWPCPQPRKPKWWQVSDRRIDNAAAKAIRECGFGPLSDEMRQTFWREISTGQGYDDAGGFLWRTWSVMLGYMEPGQAWVSPSTGLRQ